MLFVVQQTEGLIPHVVKGLACRMKSNPPQLSTNRLLLNALNKLILQSSVSQ
jgi:hypothetical protein